MKKKPRKGSKVVDVDFGDRAPQDVIFEREIKAWTQRKLEELKKEKDKKDADVQKS